MSKTERAKQKTFADDYAQYAVPKKPHKALYVAAGVAGAAAVLVGGVFGLKFLAEHGGLKGPDVQGGAGYHEVTSAAYAADNTQESKDILDAVGDVLRFDGLTATIEQVDFDGRFLRVIYSVADYEEYRENAAWVDMSIVAYDTEEQTRRILCGSRDTYDVMTDQKENFHRNYTGIKVSIDKGETMELTFGYDKLETADSDPELVGRYTLTGIDKSQNSYTVYDAGEIDWITMSPLGVMISSPAQYGCNEDFAFGLIFRDGETINIIDLKMDEIVGDKNFGREKSRNGVAANVQGTETANQFEMNNGNWLTIIESLLPDPIDVNDIAAVIINGGEIPLNVYTGMELDGAKELLAKNGIDYDITEFASEDIPEGCVIRTEPEPGLLGEKPEKVTLYVSKEPATLNVGDSFRLNDGATAAIDEILYDGFMFKTVISVHSDDPDYYTKKTERFGDGNLFVCTDLGREWMTGVSKTASPNENGCDVIFTYYSVIPADTERHSVKIWDDSEDINRTVGYIVFGYSGDDAIPYTRTVGTESVEFGKRELTVSPYGFRLIQNDSNYQLDPSDNKITAVMKDGRTIESTVTATGEQSVPDYADYQLLFGLFDEPFDLVEVYSLNFFGETFVLNDSSEMIEITETNE